MSLHEAPWATCFGLAVYMWNVRQRGTQPYPAVRIRGGKTAKKNTASIGRHSLKQPHNRSLLSDLPKLDKEFRGQHHMQTFKPFECCLFAQPSRLHIIRPQVFSAEKPQRPILYRIVSTHFHQHHHSPTKNNHTKPGLTGPGQTTDHTKFTRKNLPFIYGLLHAQRLRRDISRRFFRAQQGRRRCFLGKDCWRIVEDRVEFRVFGLATGGKPTVRGGRKRLGLEGVKDYK